MPENARVAAKAAHFELPRLLGMDKDYFTAHVWPHMFYMGPEKIWKWKMNAAGRWATAATTVMFRTSPGLLPPRGRARTVHGRLGLGRIGGHRACEILHRFLNQSEGDLRERSSMP
jgi:epoxyqueuosine reductase